MPEVLSQIDDSRCHAHSNPLPAGAVPPLSHLTALLQHNVPYNFIILLTFQLLNPLNAELNPICHLLLLLLGGATIVVVSRLRVNALSVSSFLRRLKIHLQLGGKLADPRLKHDLANYFKIC